jgi:hypothetical protein
MFKFDASDGLGQQTVFTLRDCRFNQNNVNCIAVQDVQRGISRTTAQINRTIQLIVSGVKNNGNLTPVGWQVEITGAGSGADGLGVGQGYDLPPLFANGIAFKRNGALGGNLFGGSGVPAGGWGGIGDFYLREDTPTVANQRIYVKTGATTWTGIL